MHNCMVVKFALVACRREDITLQKRRFVGDHERLIRIACENYFIKRFLYIVLVLNYDA